MILKRKISGHLTARTRRNSEQTLEFKIEMELSSRSYYMIPYYIKVCKYT